MPYTVVQFTNHLPHGDTLHREIWPMQALASLPDFRVIAVHHLSPYRYDLAFQCDLLALGMTMDADLAPIIRWRKAKGKPTVFEVNDSVFDIDPWNTVFQVWNNPIMQAGVLHMIGLADLVQAPTAPVAEMVRPYCSRVAVFANQLAEVPDNIPPRSDRPQVVGWGGSVSHMADVAIVAPAVSKWIREHDDVMLSISGDEAIANLFTVPPEKKQHVPWHGMDRYQRFLRAVHIGVAPLRDTPFNRGRSDAKWLECAAHGCVFVGQRLQPYTDSIEDGRTGFLFDDTEELLRILDKLYRERSLMESVRRSAFDEVTKNRRHEQHIRERADLYMELLERKRPRGAEEWTLHEQSTFPRMELPQPLPDYLPVKFGGDEAQALEELHSHRSEVTEASFRLIEERYGEFHLVGFCRGVMAFRQGDPESAEYHLRRSLSLYPAAVESLRLLGQVRLAMQQPHKAREALSFATQWNPGYAPAYQYLVGAMEEESDWEAAIAATKEWEKQCNQDPWARLTRGYLLVRAGRPQEGMDLISDAMARFNERLKYWQLPFAADLVQLFRQLDGLLSEDPQWPDIILKAAELFPYGLWLAARAGAICFERGDYQRGAQILEAARERLLAWEWHMMGRGATHHYRGTIEAYRIACEKLAQ